MLSLKDQIVQAYQRHEAGAFEDALERYGMLMKEPRLKSDDFFAMAEKAGDILTKLKRFEDAREMYMTAIARAKQLKKYQRVSEFWHLSALNEVSAGHPETAIADFRNELDMTSSRNENYFFQLSTNYYEQGSLFFGEGDTAEGKLYFELALAFAETDGIVIAEAKAHDGLARYYQSIDAYEEAMHHLTTALSQYNEAKDRNGAQRMRRLLKKIKDSKNGISQ